MALSLSPASLLAADIGVHLVLLSSVMLGGLGALALGVLERSRECTLAGS
jgi:hypothetical protein